MIASTKTEAERAKTARRSAKINSQRFSEQQLTLPACCTVCVRCLQLGRRAGKFPRATRFPARSILSARVRRLVRRLSRARVVAQRLNVRRAAMAQRVAVPIAPDERPVAALEDADDGARLPNRAAQLQRHPPAGTGAARGTQHATTPPARVRARTCMPINGGSAQECYSTRTRTRSRTARSPAAAHLLGGVRQGKAHGRGGLLAFVPLLLNHGCA